MTTPKTNQAPEHLNSEEMEDWKHSISVVDDNSPAAEWGESLISALQTISELRGKMTEPTKDQSILGEAECTCDPKLLGGTCPWHLAKQVIERLDPTQFQDPKEKDRAKELSADYEWSSLGECLNAQKMVRQRESELRKETDQREALVVEECIKTLDKFLWKNLPEEASNFVDAAKIDSKNNAINLLKTVHPNHAAILAGIERKVCIETLEDARRAIWKCRDGVGAVGAIAAMIKKNKALQPKEADDES